MCGSYVRDKHDGGVVYPVGACVVGDAPPEKQSELGSGGVSEGSEVARERRDARELRSTRSCRGAARSSRRRGILASRWPGC